MDWFCTQRCISPHIQSYRESELCLRLLIRNNGDVLFTVAPSDDLLCIASYSNKDTQHHAVDNRTPSILDLSKLAKQEVLLQSDWKYSLVEYTLEEEISTFIPYKYLMPDTKDHKSTKEASKLLSLLYASPSYSLEHSSVQTQDIDIENIKRNKLSCGIISSAPSFYKSAILDLFPQALHRSASSGLTEMLFATASSYKRFPFHVLLYSRPPFFDLLVKTPEGLVLANTYPYPSFENLLYYTLFALNKLKLDLGNTLLVLGGQAREEHLSENLENHITNIQYLPFDTHCLCTPALTMFKTPTLNNNYIQ